MARNRVIYQSEALFINQDSAYSGGYNQIERVQSANYSYTINRQDINQYGQLGKLDSIIIDSPTVSADVSYYLTDGFTVKSIRIFCIERRRSRVVHLIPTLQVGLSFLVTLRMARGETCLLQRAQKGRMPIYP